MLEVIGMKTKEHEWSQWALCVGIYKSRLNQVFVQ